MKKIVFIIGIMGNGGAERVVAILSNYLSKKEYDVSVITIYGNRQDYQLDNKVKHYPIICKSVSRILRPLERIRKVRRVIKSIEPDSVISFLTDVNIHTLFAMIGLKYPLILSERNDPNNDPSERWQRMLRNIIYSRCDGIVFQTKDAAAYFDRILSFKIHKEIIPNPISPNLPYYSFGENKRRFITACRLTPQKNLPLMIDAFAEIIQKGYDCMLDIFGDGPLKEELTKYIEKKQLTTKIHLCGFSKCIYDEMLNSLAFIISSDYEGISNSMLEALAIGLPVIATDCPIGGARDSICNGVNGLLVPVGNKMELVRAMEKILKFSELGENLSRESVKIRKLLSIDNIADKWIDIIKRVSNDKGGR